MAAFFICEREAVLQLPAQLLPSNDVANYRPLGLIAERQAASATQPTATLAEVIGRPAGRSSKEHTLVNGPAMRCISEGSAGGSRTAAWCRSPKGTSVARWCAPERCRAGPGTGRTTSAAERGNAIAHRGRCRGHHYDRGADIDHSQPPVMNRDEEMWGAALWRNEPTGPRGRRISRQIRRLASGGESAGGEMWRSVRQRYDHPGQATGLQ